MTVQELIDVLQQMPNKSLPVVLTERGWDTECEDALFVPARYTWDNPRVELS